MALRKTIIRTVVQEIIVNEDATAGELQFIVHWRGGSHTRFDMPKPQWGLADQTAPEAIELIRQMAIRYSDGLEPAGASHRERQPLDQAARGSGSASLCHRRSPPPTA
jgi:hypothetical protein